MNYRKILLMFVLVLILVFPVSAEIVVLTSNTQQQETSNVKHTFEVNQYIPQQKQEGQFQSIKIEPIISEATIQQCGRANFSFKLTNVAPTEQLYTFGVKNFHGVAYITPNLRLNPGNIALVRYQLQPNCSVSGTLNPNIVVETKTEKAKVPIVLHVNKTKQVQPDQDACLTHFNQSVCDSNYYIRMYEDSRYEIDLGQNFYDPDGDELEYGYANGFNIRIRLRNDKAILRPSRDWTGTEEIVFTAEDGKGGYAESRKFYVHVLEKEGFSLFRWLANLFG